MHHALKIIVLTGRRAASSVIAPGDPSEFTTDNGANAPMYSAVHSPAFYDAGLNKTFVSWEAWTGVRSQQVTSLDHSTGYFSDIEGMGQSFLVDDEHGNPVIVLDHENHLHCFYGAHGNLLPTGMNHSSTRWPEGGGALDGSKWEIRAKIAGEYTYPHPILVGSGFHLFMRKGGSTNYPLVLYETTSLADGVATWGTEQTIVDFGADSRVYQGTAVLVGTKIHFVCAWADGASTIRQHVYYFVFDTTNGDLENHDGSVSTEAGSLPVSLATANASYRIFEHTGSNGGYVPVLAFDTDNNPFVAFIDGADSTFDVKVMKRTAGTWGSPETVAATSGAFYHYALGPLPGGEMELLYVVNNDAWSDRGGDVLRKVRTSGGSWSGEQMVLEATTHALAGLNAVRDAHTNARMTFAEFTQDALDASAGGLRVYLWGAGGLVTYQQATEATITSAADGVELREDDAAELREDSSDELREVAV